MALLTEDALLPSWALSYMWYARGPRGGSMAEAVMRAVGAWKCGPCGGTGDEWCDVYGGGQGLRESMEDRGAAPIRRACPRPLMPLLLFLYTAAKYIHSSRSSSLTSARFMMEANFLLSSATSAMWNLFWCFCTWASGFLSPSRD